MARARQSKARGIVLVSGRSFKLKTNISIKPCGGRVGNYANEGGGAEPVPPPGGRGGAERPLMIDSVKLTPTFVKKIVRQIECVCVCVSFPVLELKPGANGKRPGRRNRREGRGAGLRDGRRGKRNCLKWNKWNPHYHKSIQSIIYLFLFFFSLFFFKCLLPYSFFFYLENIIWKLKAE